MRTYSTHPMEIQSESIQKFSVLSSALRMFYLLHRSLKSFWEIFTIVSRMSVGRNIFINDGHWMDGMIISSNPLETPFSNIIRCAQRANLYNGCSFNGQFISDTQEKQT